MARIRTVKPEMPGHPTIARLSRDARLLFVWLITDADDDGRFVAAPKRLAGQLFPLDDDVDAAMVAGWLDELVAQDLVELYQHDGGRFGQIRGWTDHQRISKPTPSRLPAPPRESHTHTPSPPANPPGNSGEPPETPRESLADLGPWTMDQDQDHSGRPPAAQAGSQSAATLTPWDQARALLAHTWPTEPAYVLDGWAAELTKIRRRIRHPYPPDLDPAAIATLLASTAMTTIGARPALISNPDRARLISQIEALMRATPPPDNQPHVDTEALLGRWATRLQAIAPTRPAWTVHELATRTVATWDQHDPKPNPVSTANTAVARQKARLARLAEVNPA